MSLATNVTDLATRVATEAKALRTLLNGNAANNSALTTTAKSNLVAAINELHAEVQAAAGGAAGINDSAPSTTSTYSSTKIESVVAAVVDAAPGALDTLNELAAALGDDANFAATVNAALGNRVRYDAAQALTAPQAAQARSNIGAASAADVGDTTTNFVTVFEAGL